MYQQPPTLTDIINKLDEILKEQKEFIEYLKCKNFDKAQTFSVACKCSEIAEKIKEVNQLNK